MKRSFFILGLAASAMLAVTACEEKSPEPTVSVNIEVVPAEGATVPEGTLYDVTVTNYDTRIEQSYTTDEEGKLTVNGLVMGRYTISAAASIAEDGISYLCTGTVSNANLLTDGETITVEVDVVKSSQLLIKEYYYAFSKTAENKNYIHDQFIEVYNNSEETAYVDGLCLAFILPELATGKANYNWGFDTQEYIPLSRVLQAPGKVGGKEYPLEPGESVLFCKWARNHQAEDANPNSPVDLSGGEFEYYFEGGTAQTDESAINLTLAYSRTTSNYTQWTSSLNGFAYVLFFPTENDFSDKNVVKEIDNGVMYCYKLPASQVLDAVEALQNETQVANKRVPDALDAGAIWTTDENGEPATGTGRSLVRKVASTTEGGRVILQDTNNSANDFECMTAVARRYNAGIPSWNTWAKR